MAVEIKIPRLGWSMEEGSFLGWRREDGDLIEEGEAIFELEGEKASQEVESTDGGILRILQDCPSDGDVVKVGRVIGYLVDEGEEIPSAPGSVVEGAPTIAASEASAPTESAALSDLALEVKIPRLGWSMEEGVFLGWLVVDGDVVEEGDPLFELEGEKAAQEVESIDHGILRILPDCPESGDVVQVGLVIGYLAKEGVALAVILEVKKMVHNRGSVPTQEPSRAPTAPASREGSSRTTRAERIPASPRALRAAKKMNVDISMVQPSGNGGRIRERDVLAASGSSSEANALPVTIPMTGTPITTMRRTIASRMKQSLQATAPVTLTCSCDATNLMEYRQQFKDAGIAVVPSYNDIIVKISAIALDSHPMIAGRWNDDEILLPDQINIGIAVDTENGLLVPVIRDVPKSSLLDVAMQSKELVTAIRENRVQMDDLQGGCFTISNLGFFGIEAFTPIINYPESAILGIGAIIPEPVVLEDGTIGVRQQFTLSLTFDHRVVDGAPAARFLEWLREGISDPAAWLPQELMG